MAAPMPSCLTRTSRWAFSGSMIPDSDLGVGTDAGAVRVGVDEGDVLPAQATSARSRRIEVLDKKVSFIGAQMPNGWA
jgi:hypothetical protein